jgi:hypothetical protein
MQCKHASGQHTCYLQDYDPIFSYARLRAIAAEKHRSIWPMIVAYIDRSPALPSIVNVSIRPRVMRMHDLACFPPSKVFVPIHRTTRPCFFSVALLASRLQSLIFKKKIYIAWGLIFRITPYYPADFHFSSARVFFSVSNEDEPTLMEKRPLIPVLNCH